MAALEEKRERICLVMSELFRKKSMEKVNSPEQLNDYIHVANPGVWMVLAAIIILLIGVCVWGVFGHLDTEMEAAGVCRDGTLTCYIKEADISAITEETLVSVGGNEYFVAEISAFSVRFEEAEQSELLAAGYFQGDERVCVLIVSAPDLPDGSYEVSLILRRETPISFVLS